MSQDTISFTDLISKRYFSMDELRKVNPLSIDFHALSRYKHTNYHFIEEFLDGDWDFPYLCQDSYFQWTNKIMKKHIAKMNHQDLSRNEYFNLKWIQWYPEGNWDFRCISYHILELKDALPFQNKNLDFMILSRNMVNVSTEWFKVFGDRKWDFKELLKHRNFEPSWLTYIPASCWDFQHISKLKQKIFTSKELGHFSTENWNFKYLSRYPYLDIDCLYAIPNQKWEAAYVIQSLCRKTHILIRLLYLQSHFHQIFSPMDDGLPTVYPLLKILKKLPYQKVSKDLNTFVMWMVIFNHQNLDYIGNLLTNPEVFPYQNIEELPIIPNEEKEIIFDLIVEGVIWESYPPGMTDKRNYPLTIYDLSGTAFTIEYWWDVDILLELQTQYPELGKIDIFVDGYYFSKLSAILQKNIILRYEMENDAILVYPDDESETLDSNDSRYKASFTLIKEHFHKDYHITQEKLYMQYTK